MPARSWFIPRRFILAVGLGFLLLAGLILIRTGYQSYSRWRWGIPRGVTLLGEPMGGLLREEARLKVTTLGERYYREPQEAWFDQATNRVVPERYGQRLDVEKTLDRLFAARPGERVSPVIIPVVPKVTQRHFQAVYRGGAALPRVALMINVAWGEEVLPSLLDLLDQEGVRCTFFIVGSWARQFPDLVKEIAARGHEIGNHGLWHGHPTRMTEQERERLIVGNQQLLEGLGVKVAAVFTPPYGEVSPEVVRTAARLGYYTIMWTRDTVDWKRPAPEVILDRILAGAGPGDLILMHPVAETVEVLPTAITRLRAKGLEPVTVSEVLAGWGKEEGLSQERN